MNYVTLQVKAFFGVWEDWEVMTENLYLSQKTLQNSFFLLYKERELELIRVRSFFGKKSLQIFGLTFYSNFSSPKITKFHRALKSLYICNTHIN